MTLWNLSRLLVLLSVVAVSCKSQDAMTAEQDKVRQIRFFTFVYDMECMDLGGRQRCDTTFWTASIPDDQSIHLLYAVNGECSVCLSKALDFIDKWLSIENPDSVPCIVLKGREEYWQYYFSQFCQELSEEQLQKTGKIDVISVPAEVYAPDGMYLIFKNRIIKYEEWKI